MQMGVVQPAAKMLVELSKSQDVVAGDGTTTGMYSALGHITLFSSRSTLTFPWEVEKKFSFTLIASNICGSMRAMPRSLMTDFEVMLDHHRSASLMVMHELRPSASLMT